MQRLDDITTLTDDERQLLRRVKAAVLQHEPTAEVIIYGSATRGAREPDSDYDVLALVDRPLSVDEENTIDAAVYEVELAQGVVISLIIFARQEWNSPPVASSFFHRNVSREGALL